MIAPLFWVLVAGQVAMGVFDTLYHHEWTERLAWRPSQGHELRLHAVRNGVYALLFLTLAIAEPRGGWAILVMALLLFEVAITLLDFVEEDMSCRLPASERVNHTLLALNYGGILVLVLPLLIEWAGQPSRIVWTDHGAWSLLGAAAALGVALFGLRDFAASRRAARLTQRPAGALARALPGRRTVLVTGATGFIGRRLVDALVSGGHDVIALVRTPARAAEVLRPPYRLITSLDDVPSDTPIDAVVNLAGAPIGDGLWTLRKRRRALSSRLRMTRDVIRLIGRLETRPDVLVNGSAIGWYGLRRAERLTEADAGHACFSHRLCDAWERQALRAEALGVRVVRLRIGLVLGTEGGLMARLLTPFEFGLGGPLGSGRQWMSWIERDDLVRLIVHAMAVPDLSGALNAVAPQPVRNDALAKALGRALHRPSRIRVPAPLLRLIGGDFADELLLGGQRVVPDRALASGFVFRHRSIESAFGALLGGAARPDHSGPFLVDATPARGGEGSAVPTISCGVPR